MIPPTQIERETDKAFAAFRVYCEVDGSVGKVAKKLDCSCENIRKWKVKNDWKARFAGLKQAECAAKIAAEEKALEKVALVTELERAGIARQVFDAACECIVAARKMDDKHPAKTRLLATGFTILQAVGGTAQNYATQGTIEVETRLVGEGQPGRSISMTPEEAELIIENYEKTQLPELPCDGWSKDSPDATPIVEADPSAPSPDFVEREENPDYVPGPRAPSRVDSTPTSDGRGAHGVKRPSCMVKVTGI